MTNTSTSNYLKYNSQNPLQKILLNNFNKILINLIRQVEPDKILDAGCGEGFMLDKLHKFEIGRKLIGIDNSDVSLRIARQSFPKLNIYNGDIYNLNFKDNSFDLVISSEVLEHLVNPDKALRELSRVTNKYLILSVPHEPWFRMANFLRGKDMIKWGNNIEHINHWSLSGFLRLLYKYNLSVQKVYTPFPWILVLAKVK